MNSIVALATLRRPASAARSARLSAKRAHAKAPALGVASALTLHDAALEKRALLGLKWSEARRLAVRLEIPMARLAELAGLSASTFFARKGRKFASDESDRILRFERLLSQATQTFEDQDGAVEWLKEPNAFLRGEVPLHKARTEAGARQVEALLQRIDFGLA
jgi:putative toxin-antitoxin system antitoxin component (TIGR02293 family)